MINFSKKIWDLRNEIIDEIKKILIANGNQVNIPFFYDEDEIDENIKSLIEDEYKVQNGNPNDNLLVHIENYCGYRYSTEIVCVYLNKRNDVFVVTSKNNLELITFVELDDICTIYEKLVEYTKD